MVWGLIDSLRAWLIDSNDGCKTRERCGNKKKRKVTGAAIFFVALAVAA